MKISELSRQTGVPVASIKFYLREGLLPPGERTRRNQAEYGDSHVRRLALVRALRDVGGLSVAAIARIVSALDGRTKSVYDLMGEVVDALGGCEAGERPLPATEEYRAATAAVDDAIATLGWQVRPVAAARRELIDAVVRLRGAFGEGNRGAFLAVYARAADAVARGDMGTAGELLSEAPERALETAALGTVLAEPVLLALRRLALEHHSRKLVEERFRRAPRGGQPASPPAPP